jgi:CDP-4-dehydro-6-deoxyglucose reductase, E1
MTENNETKEKILSLVEKYYNENFQNKFVAGETFIHCSGKLFDQEEFKLGVESILDGWWTEGRFAEQFEKDLVKFLGVKYIKLVNSGSSANLIALAALTSHLLEEKRLKKGDEVITVAAGFPTTVNPIIQLGMVPVFVDVEIGNYNAAPDEIENAITDKTKAIFMAHTLGNPFNLTKVKELCEKHNLWLIEDCCDALGSEFDGKKVGTFGDIATLSFYPAHHITTGEGGAVFTNDNLLSRAIGSFRDWGKDCWCPPGVDNKCGKRFSQQHGDLPFGYDHKYVFSHLGYNLKLTDMQASIGIAQLCKIDSFIEMRKNNFYELIDFFSKYSDKFYLPESEEGANPSWFGFPLTIREHVGFTREELINFLNDNKVGTRFVFGGNLTKQPYFKNHDVKYRVVGNLKNTDIVMNNSFWIGVQPNLTKEMLEYMKKVFEKFFEGH